MKVHDILSHRARVAQLAAVLIAIGCNACSDEHIGSGLDYTVIGKEVVVTVPVNFPQMDVQSRANMTDNDLNNVQSLWVATFNATTGAMTSGGWQNTTATPNTQDVEVPHEVSFKTTSGPSYIVAVANVATTMGVTPDNLTPRPLSQLLTDGMTWSDFLNIGVSSPSTQDLVNAPNPPLAMSGAFTNIAVGNPHNPQRPLGDWQNENFTPYTIPYNESGAVTLTDGAIHMRRLVSQVTFNLIPGRTGDIGMRITPHSYRVINVPKYSWLYERAGEESDNIINKGANFGDACTRQNAGDYYAATSDYTSNNIPSTGNGSYSFNFWQGENKHQALQGQNVTDYDGRDLEGTTPISGVTPVEGQYTQTTEGTGLFTALTGNAWTPNNMATYVLISCSVDYESQINVDGQGAITDGGTPVNRTGDATFLVHLGYINSQTADFNCYRNTQYTYNLTINGVNDIRVEAFHGSETPGVSGMVADVEGTFRTLDCHYNAYNIQLDAAELSAYNPDDNSGFGFLMTTYDSGAEKTYSEDDFITQTFDALSAQDKQYLDWVELKPTTGANVMAAYTPRGAQGSTTFNLADASKGIRDDQKSSTGWYTVFVREYTYEADGANESVYVNGKPIWHRYVFASPRRFYIRTTKAVSSDGQSLYTRAKYAGVQNSIMSYYDQNAVPESTATGKVNGSAIGVELVNEVYGMNLRQSYAGDNESNGRYNCWGFYNRTVNSVNYLRWDNVVDQTANQSVKESTNYGADIKAQTFPIPKLYQFRGTLGPTNYDPQPSSNNRDDYIEAINACMNRNRDNNGDGVIDKEELRWYVPAMGKYLRMLIGQDALAPNQLVDYAGMPTRPVNLNDLWGMYLFYGSEGRVLWAMEGLSSSMYNQWGVTSPVSPWQVRCIRNLGTNLGTIVENADPTIPAYKYTVVNSDGVTGRVEMSYYQATTMRTTAYNGNGTGANQMPAHTIAQEYNSLYRYGFEIHQPSGNTIYDGTITHADTQSGGYYNRTYTQGWDNLITSINTNPSGNPNPCTQLGDRWRLPNIKELAIMRNLGIFDGIGNNDHYLSCSIGVITGDGTKITNPTDQRTTNGQAYNQSNGNMHYFMNAVKGQITQAMLVWDSNQSRNVLITPFYVRCVRDYIP